jgi:hypothetical protein
MKTVDFFYLGSRIVKSLVIGFSVGFGLPVLAEQPDPEAFIQASPLILTLSEDEVLDQSTGNANFHHSPPSTISSSINQRPATEKANIGCNMDMIPDVNSDTSLSSRMVGECNFNYKY